MYFRFILFFLLFTTIAGSVFSQGFTISGRVFDAETNEPLQFAHVFIDQTTHGTVTNSNGEFFLENLEAGEYRLVFSFVGFELFNRSVSISDNDMIVNARLVPQNAILQNIEVKGTKDKEWENNLKDFYRIFLGMDEFARQCRILNPWVIDFDFDKSTKKLTATASQPIEIENKALGYQINCSLQSFEFTSQTYRIKGLYRFNEMEATHDDEARRNAVGINGGGNQPGEQRAGSETGAPIWREVKRERDGDGQRREEIEGENLPAHPGFAPAKKCAPGFERSAQMKHAGTKPGHKTERSHNGGDGVNIRWQRNTRGMTWTLGTTRVTCSTCCAPCPPRASC